MEHEPISWEAFEYEPRRRSADWYWAVAIISLAIGGISVYFGNILFGILVVLSAGILTMYAARKPHIITYSLDHEGLKMENRLYPYETLESFWIEDEAFLKQKLLFKSKKMLVPYIVVILHDDLDKEVLRAYLRQFLKEVHHDEPVAHKVLEYLGF